MGNHVMSFGTNLKVFLALVALTIFTVYTAKFVDLGHLNILLAMGIATVKVYIVMSWFMHLKYEGIVNRTLAVCAFFFLILLFGLSYSDLFYREWWT